MTSKEDLIELLLEICDISGYTPHTKNIANPIPIREIIEASVRGSVIQNLQHKYSKQKISTAIKYTFPDRDSTKNTAIPKFLLAKAELSHCKKCGMVKPFEEFYRCSIRGIFAQCKECSKTSRILSYEKDPQKEIQANTTRKRSRDKYQTPKWADLSKITEFYSNRVEGYHVDHIYPLNGKYVSGLHVIDNLQYLTIEENLKKSNRYTP